jgi:hypothetical protein
MGWGVYFVRSVDMTPPQTLASAISVWPQPAADAEAKVLVAAADRHVFPHPGRSALHASGSRGRPWSATEEVAMTARFNETDVDGGQGTRQGATEPESSERAVVRQQLQARRDFASHLFVFFVVNTAVVLIWAITGSGYFWPAWLIGLWAIGVVMHGWDAFIRRPVTEDDVDAVLRKHGSRR